MKWYLLDSTPLAGFLHGRVHCVDRLNPLLARREVATSVLVYAEVTEYLKGLPDYDRRHEQLRTLLRSVYPYFLTYPILDRYADIRRRLRPPYGPGLIGDIDTLIAAAALERNLTVITTDTDFERVPDLQTLLLPRAAWAGQHHLLLAHLIALESLTLPRMVI
jgi:predicted nucleic acid-binding protein